MDNETHKRKFEPTSNTDTTVVVAPKRYRITPSVTCHCHCHSGANKNMFNHWNLEEYSYALHTICRYLTVFEILSQLRLVCKYWDKESRLPASWMDKCMYLDYSKSDHQRNIHSFKSDIYKMNMPGPMCLLEHEFEEIDKIPPHLQKLVIRFALEDHFTNEGGEYVQMDTSPVADRVIRKCAAHLKALKGLTISSIDGSFELACIAEYFPTLQSLTLCTFSSPTKSTNMNILSTMTHLTDLTLSIDNSDGKMSVFPPLPRLQSLDINNHDNSVLLFARLSSDGMNDLTKLSVKLRPIYSMDRQTNEMIYNLIDLIVTRCPNLVELALGTTRLTIPMIERLQTLKSLTKFQCIDKMLSTREISRVAWDVCERMLGWSAFHPTRFVLITDRAIDTIDFNKYPALENVKSVVIRFGLRGDILIEDDIYREQISDDLFRTLIDRIVSLRAIELITVVITPFMPKSRINEFIKELKTRKPDVVIRTDDIDSRVQAHKTTYYLSQSAELDELISGIFDF